MTKSLDSLDEVLTSMGLKNEFEVRHVYPIEDIMEHDLESTDCQCSPLIEFHGGTIIVIHNTWDKSMRVELFHLLHGDVIL